jgi:hypothetical protein
MPEFGKGAFGAGPFGIGEQESVQPTTSGSSNVSIPAPVNSQIARPPTNEKIAPHFNLPFVLGHSGAGVVQQGTQPDLANCVFAIVATPKRWRDERPSFGIVDPTFDVVPVFNDNVRADVIAQEPRANLLFNEREGMYQFERLVKIVVS